MVPALPVNSRHKDEACKRLQKAPEESSLGDSALLLEH